MDKYQQIIHLTDNMQEKLIELRRDFHRYAEGGWREIRTSSRIARELQELGYQVLVGEAVCRRDARMGVPDADTLAQEYQRAIAQGADPEFAEQMQQGMTGVIAILRCGEGPTVAMRFDIDALGVVEAATAEHRPAAEGFASVNPGFMHACGHDGHAAIGLGVANVLARLRDQLHGTVKLIFQPAEEGVRGAKAIVANGHLDDVQYLLGAHISDKEADAPAVVIPGSYGSLATTKYDVVFHGRSAHAGSSQHLGKNVMPVLATAILNLYAIPHHGDGETRINVGVVHAGSGRNVVADEARMEIEVRGETTELNHYMQEHATRIIAHAAQMYDCRYELQLMGEADSLHSDTELAARIAAVCCEKLQLQPAEVLLNHNSGSEDFSYMMNRVQEMGGQASFMRVLTVTAGPAHNRYFDFDEQVLPNAVKIFCATACNILS